MKGLPNLSMCSQSSRLFYLIGCLWTFCISGLNECIQLHTTHIKSRRVRNESNKMSNGCTVAIGLYLEKQTTAYWTTKIPHPNPTKAGKGIVELSPFWTKAFGSQYNGLPICRFLAGSTALAEENMLKNTALLLMHSSNAHAPSSSYCCIHCQQSATKHQ